MIRRPSPEERHLWNAVARSVTPKPAARPSAQKPGFAPDLLRREMEVLMGARSDIALPTPPLPNRKKAAPVNKLPAQPRKPVAKRGQSPRGTHPIEERVLRDLRRGKIALDGRIDLHGLTQDVARNTLHHFLHTSHATGKRHVLVITGKGNDGTGVLRRNVPVWLNMPPLADFVNGFREAHGEHGGAGALYVRLHRRRA